MKVAKLTVSAIVPRDPLMEAVSSGVELKMHPATADRSFGNRSFETPTSTLWASLAKMRSDLF